MNGGAFVRAFLAAFLAAFLGACSDSGDRDPYKLVTLKEACYGGVVSKGFKYKFANPEIVSVNHGLGLIREGNQLELIAARGLEEKLAGAPGRVELAVVKKFNPYVYFNVERIVTQGDTVFPALAGAVVLPMITTAEDYDASSFVKQDIDAIPYNSTELLQRLAGRKIHVRGKLVREKAEGKTLYYLEGKGARFRLSDTSDGIGLIMKLLAEKNYVFEGGVTMTDIERFSDRRVTRTAGTFEVNYVMYGNRLITG